MQVLKNRAPSKSASEKIVQNLILEAESSAPGHAQALLMRDADVNKWREQVAKLEKKDNDAMLDRNGAKASLLHM